MPRKSHSWKAGRFFRHSPRSPAASALPHSPSSVGYRNPAHLAKIAAGVDLISRGRLTFGFGAGWHEPEYRQYGWEFPPRPAVRIRQMEEAVRLIVAMWTEKRTTFHGRYFRAEDAILEPKPAQKPHPPIMIAGGGEQLTLRAVARLADACNVGGSPDGVRHKFAVLRSHCDAEQRPYDAIEQNQHHQLSVGARRGFNCSKATKAGRSSVRTMDLPAPSPRSTDLVGQYQDAGVQLLISSAYKNDLETHELLAADVMPHFP